MAAIFGPAANLVAKVTLLAAAGVIVAGLALWWLWPRTDYARHVRSVVEQPVPFSHQHHVAGLGLDCRFCHTAVEVSSNAGLPPTYTCMTCHSQIWTNAALLTPVRESLSIHIAKGVGCESCHGAIETMPLTYKAKTLTMEFCLDCHRNPGPNLRPKSAIYDTEWRRTVDNSGAAALMVLYHVPDRTLTDCSLCHR